MKECSKRSTCYLLYYLSGVQFFFMYVKISSTETSLCESSYIFRVLDTTNINTIKKLLNQFN